MKEAPLFMFGMLIAWGSFFEIKSRSGFGFAIVMLILLHLALFGMIHGQSVHRGEKPCRPWDIAGFVLWPPTFIFFWLFIARKMGITVAFACWIFPFIPMAILHLISLMFERRKETQGFAYRWSILWFMRHDPRESYLDTETGGGRIEELKRKRLP